MLPKLIVTTELIFLAVANTCTAAPANPLDYSYFKGINQINSSLFLEIGDFLVTCTSAENNNQTIVTPSFPYQNELPTCLSPYSKFILQFFWSDCMTHFRKKTELSKCVDINSNLNHFQNYTECFLTSPDIQSCYKTLKTNKTASVVSLSQSQQDDKFKCVRNEFVGWPKYPPALIYSYLQSCPENERIYCIALFLSASEQERIAILKFFQYCDVFAEFRTSSVESISTDGILETKALLLKLTAFVNENGSYKTLLLSLNNTTKEDTRQLVRKLGSTHSLSSGPSSLIVGTALIVLKRFVCTYFILLMMN